MYELEGQASDGELSQGESRWFGVKSIGAGVRSNMTCRFDWSGVDGPAWSWILFNDGNLRLWFGVGVAGRCSSPTQSIDNWTKINNLLTCCRKFKCNLLRPIFKCFCDICSWIYFLLWCGFDWCLSLSSGFCISICSPGARLLASGCWVCGTWCHESLRKRRNRTVFMMLDMLDQWWPSM